MRQLILLSLLLFLGPTLSQANPLPANLSQFFGKYCVSCHGPAKQEADFRADLLHPAETPEQAEYWQLVLDNLHLGEMPPPKHQPQPAIDEIEPVTRWIEAELERARHAFKGNTGEVVLRRLNKTEYENTIHDLFHIRGDFTASFPEDTEEHGFDNNGAALMLSSAQIDAYLEASNQILDRAIAPDQQPETKKGTLTLQLINERNWKNSKVQLESRLKEFDRLTEEEKKRTRQAQEAFEANPHYAFLFPAWTGSSMRAPTPDDPPDTDYLLTIRSYHSNTPSTRYNFAVHHAGWYRFTITAYAIKNQGKPVRLRLEYGSFRGGTVPQELDTIYLTSNSPREYTYDVYLQAHDRIDFRMLDGQNWAQAGDMLGLEGPFIAVRSAEIEGPIHEQWPPAGHRTIFGDHNPDDLTPESVAGIIAHFGERLFRRPLTPDQVGRYTQLYQSFTEAFPPKQSLRSTFEAMMLAPQFLYHLEPPQQLDAYSVASRLSYFLWRSTPDEQLLQLAASGQLLDPTTLYEQTERLLADPKSQRFVQDFTRQWLRTDEVGVMVPDAKLYPEYDEELERAMVQETEGFLAEMFYKDLPLTDLVDSNWAILNERLAEHYRIPGVEGPQFRKVALDKSQTIRGGILTQASLLMVTSNGTTTSPIIRGVWVLDHLLGTPAPPPPPDVPAIEPDIRGASNIKEQLAAHRDIPQCASCHVKIDPFGIALENFDVIGGWRDHYRALDSTGNANHPQLVDGQPVVANDTIPNVGPYDDFRQFRQILLDHQHLINHNLADKLATFALGRTLTFADRDHLDQITQLTTSRNGGMRTMVHALIQNPLFREP